MNHLRQTISLSAALLVLAGMGGCGKWGSTYESEFLYKNLPIAAGTAAAGEGNSVTFKGAPKALVGAGIKVGDTLRDVTVIKTDLAPVNLADTKGKVRIISIVPSLDTVVCEQQTHYLSEKNHGLDQMVELITISVDTPFAQSRFAKDAKINNIMFLSDYRGGDFGKANGLLVKDPHFLARAVMVVDKDNVVRYLQVTPELAQLPDMDAAFRAAKQLLAAG